MYRWRLPIAMPSPFQRLAPSGRRGAHGVLAHALGRAADVPQTCRKKNSKDRYGLIPERFLSVP
jgi:hypothetical protein